MYDSVSSAASHEGGDVGPAGGGGGGVVPYNLSNSSGKWFCISERFPSVSRINRTRGRNFGNILPPKNDASANGTTPVKAFTTTTRSASGR